jgi:deoxyribodipyrimidine photo-lyase
VSSEAKSHSLKKRALLLFRTDLRLHDNSALNFVSENYSEVLCAYIHSPDEEGAWRSGAASNWFLHHSLKSLASSIEERGGKLLFFHSKDSLRTVEQLVQEHAIDGVFWNRRYEPLMIERDKKLKEKLKSKGLFVQSFNSHLLWEPWEIQNQQGLPFQVFTPFWKKLTSLGEPTRPQALKKKLEFLSVKSKSPELRSLEELSLLPSINWDKEFYDFWSPGEEGAKAALKKFFPKSGQYQSQRDFPSLEGTSRLSPYLHFGSISVREVWSLLREKQEASKSTSERKEIEVYLKELGWREFAYHLLYHFPFTPDRPLREKFSAFPWVEDKSQLYKWQRGQTGYPIVDAGMRELWRTGWMHNRVRMIVASFLVKDLRISWIEGARWFWDTLVDADLASNTLGWQWAGGCGADAAPYFRVFNPYLQGAKFDVRGDYVRRWVPELAKLPEEWIHQPHEAPAEVLDRAGVKLGRDYPLPMVDHKVARDLALEAFQKIK